MTPIRSIRSVVRVLSTIAALYVVDSCRDYQGPGSPTGAPDRSAPGFEVSPAPLPVTLVGAGNIASCKNTNDDATAALLDGIPGTVFALGDNAYDNGTLTQYNTCYNPNWGGTRPAPSRRWATATTRPPTRAATSATSAAPRAIRQRATTATNSAPGTSSCSTATAPRSRPPRARPRSSGCARTSPPIPGAAPWPTGTTPGSAPRTAPTAPSPRCGTRSMPPAWTWW